ncbi:hypothetical protein B0H13DRAFT_2316551 [Mycena leptocephala]|nr:hypothetical protein B0H13DRAFT_2316551 [Mycena leptocephala]
MKVQAGRDGEHKESRRYPLSTKIIKSASEEVKLVSEYPPQTSNLLQVSNKSHFALNSYLFRFHLGPSPNCCLCLVPETVPHFLLACPAYRRQRLRLIMRLGTARLSLRLLLSTKSQPKPVLDFVRETERFPRYVL